MAALVRVRLLCEGFTGSHPCGESFELEAGDGGSVEGVRAAAARIGWTTDALGFTAATMWADYCPEHTRRGIRALPPNREDRQ
jgi:hypothetical protein